MQEPDSDTPQDSGRPADDCHADIPTPDWSRSHDDEFRWYRRQKIHRWNRAEDARSTDHADTPNYREYGWHSDRPHAGFGWQSFLPGKPDWSSPSLLPYCP